MQVNLLSIFRLPLAHAICELLAHSLWQGALLSLLTGVVIVSSRHAAAAVRYRLLVSALLLFTVGAAITFLQALSGVPTAYPAAWLLVTRPNFLSGVHISLNEGWNFVMDHSAIVARLWLCMVALLGVRLGFGIYSAERLKVIRVRPAAGEWQEKLAMLTRALGVGRKILLMESDIVRVPLVIGWRKPVLLLPIGLVNSLAPAQMEAILLHEIGHVRRQDYLFNILQSVVETLFFFNPGLLWVSSLIRREREYCCDDFALLHTQDPISYIRALVIFEEFRQRSPRSALGFINSGNGVLNRLERLSAGKNRSLRRSELLLLVAIAGIGSLLMAAGPPPVTPIRHKMTVDMSATARDLDLKAKQQAEAAALERQGRLMQNH